MIKRSAWPSLRALAGGCLALGLPLAAVAGVLAEPEPATQAGPQQEDAQGRTELPMKVSASIHFREIGPAISGGRVAAVVGVAGNPDVYYVGAADGGIFRTENGGTTWQALFQHQPVASIGALAIDPQNPSVIWAGTGEANVRNDVSYGDGIYESTDAGRHWKHLGLDHAFQISRIVVDPLHPDTVLAAAMGSPWQDDPDRGVYRTTDGGATWQKVLYTGPSVGISDLAMDPRNPEIVFAATYRFRRTPWSYSDGGPQDAIYKSIDGGRSWKRLSGNGLPALPVARIGLAIAASAPNVVYAVMGSNEGVLWRSDDAGEHWALVSKNQEVDARPFYFSHVEVDPKDPNHVFAISNDLLESTDGGHSFHTIAKKIHVDHHALWIDPAGSGRIIDGNDGGVALSVDNGKNWSFIHNLAIGQFYHIALGGGPLYEVCGGLQDNSAWCGPSQDKDPTGILDRAWITLNGGDGIYAIPAPDDPSLVYDSTQNGVFMTFDRATQQVHDMEPYPRDFVGGGVASLPYRFAWGAALAVSPADPKVLYAGGNVVFKSEDRGRTWKPISPDLTRDDKSKQGSSGGPVLKDNSGAEVYDAIISMAVAQSDPNVIWVGTDDGEVQLTRDGGASWSNVSAHLPKLPAWSRVESIDVSASDPGDVLIAANRHYSGDFKPYLFRTTDYGAHWASISGNLPSDVYAHVVRRDLHDPDLYYAGLENGLYVSWDAGKKWYLFGLGLPNAAVYDLALDAHDNDLVVATHGRALWVLDDLAPFQTRGPEVTDAPLTLFHPADALRFWPWSLVEPLGDGAFYGQNPTYGAAFSYYLSKAVKEPGELVIADSSGKVVRTLKGLHEGEPEVMTPVEQVAAQGGPGEASKTLAHGAKSNAAGTSATSASAKRGEEPEGVQAHGEESQGKEVPWVPGQAGLHRIYWDLRADGPVRWSSALKFLQGPESGALLPPGTYTATLELGGHTASQTFTVRNDPASHAGLQEMQDRYQVTEAVLHEVSQLDVALNRLHAVEGQVQALEAAVKGSPDESAVRTAAQPLMQASAAIEAKLTSNAGALESSLRVPDEIREHLLALDALLEGEDDAPTPAVLQQQTLLEPQYRAAVRAYDDFLASSVAGFNQSMAARHLTGVLPGPTLTP
jgi:photosystem II stability/assembly factor-like uncharacterized protein